jgi:chitinase, putative
MSADKYNRRVFIFSAMEFLRERNFDGLDLDWEFPKGPEDKRNFVELVKVRLNHKQTHFSYIDKSVDYTIIFLFL